MPAYIINKVTSNLGIQRDGTEYDSNACIDGQHVRFYENQPRKMGGHSVLNDGNLEPITDLFGAPLSGSLRVYQGRISTLQFLDVDLNAIEGAQGDRTPIAAPDDGWTPGDENNRWSFDLASTVDAGGVQANIIIAHVSATGNDISSTITGPIFQGDNNSSAPLTIINGEDTNPVVTSGGVIFCKPVMVAFGNNGVIRWSNTNITTWSTTDTAVITNTKLVVAKIARGGTQNAMLVWSLNSLIRCNVVPIEDDADRVSFSATPIASNISIISPYCVVEYDSVYFWIGVDRFYYYNGIVQTLDNTMNKDWFFDNVNMDYRTKIFGIALTRYDEIWWYYPRGTSTVCNAVIIFNVKYKVWYDTMSSRGAGLKASLIRYPILADSTTVKIATPSGFADYYPLWLHEKGVDRVINSVSFAIKSYFETQIIDLFSTNGQNTRLIRNRRIAPNFRQEGTMSVSIKNRFYPNGAITTDGPHNFTDTTEKIDFATQGNLVSFVFQSNERGGFYQGGKTLYFYDIGDTLK